MNIYFNNIEIELPKKTMVIARKEDYMLQAPTREEAYKRQFEYCQLVLGKKLEEVLGSNDINQIDLIDLTCLCNAIEEGFKKKIYDQQSQAANEAANNAALDKIIQVGNSLSKIDNVAKHYSK